MRILFLLLSVLCLPPSAFSQSVIRPLAWEVDTARPAQKEWPLVRGETVDLECRYLSGAAAMDVSGAAVVLHARTNGMPADLSFQVTGRVGRASSTNLASVGWVTVRVLPDLDLPHDAARCTFVLETTLNSARNLVATGTLRLSGDPTGTTPAALPTFRYDAAGSAQAVSNALAGALQDLSGRVDALPPPPVVPVSSVNGSTGDVTITAAQLGALTAEADPEAGPRLALLEAGTNDWRQAWTWGDQWQSWLATNTFVRAEQDAAALRLYHYGSSLIIESPADWFAFDGVGTITAYNYAGGREHVVVPWQIGGVAVTNINNTAFSPGGTGTPVVSVIAPRTVESVKTGAFKSCTALTDVSFPSVTWTGNAVFFDCTALTNALFPAVKIIGENVFVRCALTSIDLPSVSAINNNAFGACASLHSVVFSGQPPVITGNIYSGANAVTNYVTNPTAAGWGATLGGRPVVRPTLHGDGSQLTGIVSGIDASTASNIVLAAKEYHADSFTNLIWRTVWSNGWCYAVAFTNTP